MLLCKFTEGFRRINIPNNMRASSTPPFPAAIAIYLFNIVTLCHLFIRNVLRYLNMFKDKCSDSVLGQNSTTSLHNLLLNIDLI